MKQLIFLYLFISTPISILACTCAPEISFCDYIEKYFLNQNGMVCIAEATGNIFQDQPYPAFQAAEMKIIEFFYGEIQPGKGEYLNSDSTFWILSNGSSACYDNAVFNFQNAGEQFVLAPAYDEIRFTVPQQTGYSLSICHRDFYKYDEEITSIIEQSDLVERCLNGENDLTITCPGNTFLGSFSCLNTDEAMAPPYYIQIEGDTSIYPWGLQVTTEDDGVIFFCDGDPRMVNKEIIFFTGPGGFEGTTEIARCSFTIETIADVTPPELTIPPDIELPCGTEPDTDITGYASYESECLFNGDPLSFSDVEIIDINGGITTTVMRTWQAVDYCGNVNEQVQTITTNCEAGCIPPITGTFNCGN